MTEKKVPFTTEQIKAIIKDYPTPFHIYDEKAIRENARRFYKAFSWVPGGFKDYFAVKALPNPYIMKKPCRNGGHSRVSPSRRIYGMVWGNL